MTPLNLYLWHEAMAKAGTERPKRKAQDRRIGKTIRVKTRDGGVKPFFCTYTRSEYEELSSG